VFDGRGSADSHETKYRSDLDGLRALAVLAVIFYHISGKLLPGGYLGVDIFFVLSGYLITNIIWRECLKGTFSIGRFYERRVRRIMPALTVLLIVVSACSSLLLLPIDLLGYAKSVFATLAFVANIYFWRDTNYFAQAASEKPLLHVWSLGVEEQFYILFPLLVALCVRWRRNALVPLTWALILLSLMTNILSIKMGEATPAFFFLPMRAWELGAGALLALTPPAKPMSSWPRQALALLAAVLLMMGLFFNYRLPGGLIPIALTTVLGATIAIHLGRVGGSWLTQFFSLPGSVWIGLISYSLYLWHWPILVLSRYYFVQAALSPLQATIAVISIFALAWLSWHYVERPFRNRSMPIGRVLVWVSCGCIIAAAGAGSMLASRGFPSRFNSGVARINAAVGTEYRCGLNEYISFGALHGCLMSLPSRNPKDATVALIGDSHAQMYAPLVSSILNANHTGGILVPLAGCLPLPDYNQSSTCMELAAKNLDAVESLPKIRIVIISMTWELQPEMFTIAGPVAKASQLQALMDSLDRMIINLQQRGKTVVVVGPISYPGRDEASIVARQLAFHHSSNVPLFGLESTFMEQEGAPITHYASRTDIVFIRPDQVQCLQGRCDYIRDGASLFADDNHIAQAALPLFRSVFEVAMQRAFARNSKTN